MDKYIYAIYSEQDNDVVAPLLDDIKSQVKCEVKHLDSNDADLENSVSPVIEAAEVVLVFVSSNAKNSESVKSSLSFANDLNKTVLPVQLGSTTLLGDDVFRFRTNLYDLKTKEGRNEFYGSLKGFFSITQEAGDSYGAIVNLKSDVDVKVYKDGLFLCDLKKNVVNKIRMDEGNHLFTFQDMKDPRISVKRNYMVKIGNDLRERELGMDLFVSLQKEINEDRNIYAKKDMEIKQTKEIRNKIVTRADRMKYYIAGALLLLAVILYFAWYLPYKKDRDADRTYVYATSLFLRSEKLAGVEYNQIGKLPYGSELITYSIDGDWASVKADGKEGYVSSKYILNKEDFDLLTGIWGDSESAQTITSSKCRSALMQYCKQVRNSQKLQVYSRGKSTKPNYMAYPRVYDKLSKYTDFFCVLKDANYSDRMVLVAYSFDGDTDEPIFRDAIPVQGSGLIQSVSLDEENPNRIVIKMADDLEYNLYVN